MTTALVWLLILSLAVLLYLPALHGPLVYDDIPVLNPFLHDSLRKIAHPFWSDSGPLGRPIAMATFWLDAYFWHGSIFAFKLTNLVLDLLAATTATALTISLVRASMDQSMGSPRVFGLGVGTLWLLAPVAVSTVLYSVERMEILAALFTLMGILGYLTIRRSEIVDGRPRTGRWLVTLAVCTVLATFSKENGVLLIPMALWADYCLWKYSAPQQSRRALIALTGITIACGIGLIVAFFAFPHFLLDGYRERRFDLATRLLTEPVILWRYIGATLLPLPRWTSFFHGRIPLAHSLLSPPSTILAIAALFILFILTLVLVRRRPLAAIGLGWFFIGESIESTLVPLRLMEVVRIYLPSYGLILALVALVVPWLRSFLQKHPRGLIPLWGGFTLLALVELVLTANAVVAWQNTRNFYASNLALHPTSESARAGLAQWWLDHGRPDLAIALLSRSTRLGARLEMATDFCVWKRAIPAGFWAQLPTRTPQYVGATATTGVALLSQFWLKNQCHFQGRELAILARRLSHASKMRYSRRYILYLYRAYLAHRIGTWKETVRDLRHAIRLAPHNPVPRLLAAAWLFSAHHPHAARRWFLSTGGLPLASPGIHRLWHKVATELGLSLPSHPPLLHGRSSRA